MPVDPVDLTRRLVSIPSPSGREAEAGRFLLPVLEAAGFSVTLQPIPSAPERKLNPMLKWRLPTT